MATTLQVRARLEEGAADAALRPVIEDARGQLWTLFAMKKAVVCSESVLLIMNLEHLLPPVRTRPGPRPGLAAKADGMQAMVHEVDFNFSQPDGFRVGVPCL